MNSKKEQAFTLIEVMVALLIFAILAVIVGAGLRTVINSFQRSQIHLKKWSELEVALTVMKRDVAQAVARPVPASEDGAALIGSANGFSFTRGAYVNPQSLTKRSSLLKVSYQVKHGDLMRMTSPILAHNDNQKKGGEILLRHIQQFKFAYVDAHNQGRTFWPLLNAESDLLPRAVQVQITIQGLGSLSRLFLIPGGVHFAI